MDEIEDNLYYFSDVISAGIPDVGRLITDNILQYLIFPLLLPSLRIEAVNVWILIWSFFLFFFLFSFQEILFCACGMKKKRDFGAGRHQGLGGWFGFNCLL